MSSELKIFHIISGCGGERSTAYASAIMLGLAATGVTQFVATDGDLPRAQEIARTGIRIFRLPRVFGKFFLRAAVAQFSPSLIQCWTSDGARLLPFSRKIPAIGWLPGPGDPAHYRSCSYFVAATQAIADYCERQGTGHQRLRTISFFCDDAAACPADRALLATPQAAPVIISLSRLHPDKRPDLLLQVMTELDDAYLWLNGEGPLRRLLGNEADRLGVAARVRFVEPSMDPVAFLRAANLAVLPASRETSDIAIAQAWAAGLPVIACKNEVSCSLIADGADGLLVPPGDAAALVAAIRRILGDDSLRRRLIAEGYVAYVKNFSREAVVRRWIGFYNELPAV